MELIRGLHNVSAAHRGAALTIGNFDGVHLGHRGVLGELRAAAGGRSTALMTFEPYPREFFCPGTAPARLTGLAEKLARLRGLDLDRVLLVRFNERFAALEPDAFVREVLVERLGVATVVVGDDFRFGRGGAGDFPLLQKLAAQHGFSVVQRPTLVHDGARVSSSWIRACLAAGELAEANRLLGAPYCIQGRVAHGRELGRTIGFPTANLPLHRIAPPLSGVFAVRVQRGPASVPLRGVANLGRRPTVNGEGVVLEVHVFDFDGSLYGQRIRVEFVARLRGEQKFESLDALRAQIGRDADAARTVLGGGGAPC